MKEIFAPADDIADGEMYLRLAADIDCRIGELKARYKATGGHEDLLQHTGFEENPARTPENSAASAVPGEAQEMYEQEDRIHEYENERRLHNNEFRPCWTNGICFGSA